MRLVFLPALLPLLLLNCSSAPSTAAEETSGFAPTPEFSRYWQQGKAELTSYTLEQARYGEIHQGEAVLVFVTEDLSKTKQVKLDNPAAIASEKIREKIVSSRAQIEQNCEMVRLDLDLPLPQPLDALTIAPRYEDWIAEMRKCEFKSLTSEIEAEFARISRSDLPAAAADTTATPLRKSQSEFSF